LSAIAAAAKLCRAMPARATREDAAERADARQRILDAAVRLIAREGVDDVRIARIAMDAGVSAGLVHYHFASREALLAEALEHSYELAGDVRTLAQGGGDGAVARLAAMVEQCLPLPGAQHDDWLLWVELWLRAARRPELRDTAANLYARLHAWFTETIAEGVAAGELERCDAGRAADFAIALLDGYGVRALVGDPQLDVDTARREVWAALSERLGIG
jgi:AcrR family transcriptional regulator